MASAGDVTVIGRGVTFRGEVTGEGDVQIEGVLEGSVHVTGARITLGPEANVRAVLHAQDIVVYGHLEGELRASGRVELRSSALVVGDVFSARLAVEDEAVLRGHVDLLQAAADGTATDVAGAQVPQGSTRATPTAGIDTVAANKMSETVSVFPRNPASSAGSMPSGLAAAAASVAPARPVSGAAASPQSGDASELKNS